MTAHSECVQGNRSNTGDVDLTQGLAVVRRGKGGTGRVVPFGPRWRIIDRYLRMRRSHRLTHTEALRLGGGGQRFR